MLKTKFIAIDHLLYAKFFLEVKVCLLCHFLTPAII